MGVMLAYKTSGLGSRRRRWRRAHCCGGQEQAIKAPTQPHRHYPLNAGSTAVQFHFSSNTISAGPSKREVEPLVSLNDTNR